MIIPSDTKTETVRSVSSPSEYDGSESYDNKSAGFPEPEPHYEPPPYTVADEEPTARQNYIHINDRNNSVKGSWTIDPCVQIPPALLPQMSDNQTIRKNLRLESHNANVNAEVKLISDQPTKSFIEATSWNGSVTVNITVRRNQCFHLIASSHNGSVKAIIPPDFQGPITLTSHNGSFKYSPRVQAQISYFSKAGDIGKGFIGNLAGSGYGQTQEPWSGDELELSSHNGNVKIWFADEWEENEAGASGSGGESSVKKFFRSLLGGGSRESTESGPSTPPPPPSSQGPLSPSGYPMDKKAAI